jgi:hypothetical protein
MDGSGVFRSVSPVAAAQTLSARFWGLDLSAGLPRVISREGVYAAPGEFGRIRDFLKREFPLFTEEELGAAPHAAIANAKRRYLDGACDLTDNRRDGRRPRGLEQLLHSDFRSQRSVSTTIDDSTVHTRLPLRATTEASRRARGCRNLSLKSRDVTPIQRAPLPRHRPPTD